MVVLDARAERETGKNEDREEPKRNESNARAGGYFSCRENDRGAGDFSPLYTTESEQSSAEACTSEKNMEFVRRTMLSAKVQDVVTKVDLAGQNLLVAMNRSNPQNLRCRSQALRTALACGMGHLDYKGQHCGWPDVVKDKIAGRIQEIPKKPLESLPRRLTQMVK
jgi:hypothetical protein